MKKHTFSKYEYPTRLVDDALHIGKKRAYDELVRRIGTERAENAFFKKNKYQWIWIES